MYKLYFKGDDGNHLSECGEYGTIEEAIGKSITEATFPYTLTEGTVNMRTEVTVKFVGQYEDVVGLHFLLIWDNDYAEEYVITSGDIKKRDDFDILCLLMERAVGEAST